MAASALRLGSLTGLRNLAQALRGFLFPPACLGCGAGVAEGELLCPACAGQIEPPPAPLCPRDRKSTRLNSSHNPASRMPSSA
jgi:predicted amidophosphoribosyltransferase